MKIAVLIDREALQSRIARMIADRLGKAYTASPVSQADLLVSNLPEYLLSHLQDGKDGIHLLLPLADGQEPEPLNGQSSYTGRLHIFAAGSSRFKNDYPGLDQLLTFLLERTKI